MEMAESDMNVNDMLREVLGNPDAMKKITELANGLFGSSDKEERPAPKAAESALLEGIGDLFTSKGGESQQSQNDGGLLSGILGGLDLSRFGDEDQIRLIKALRPYLSDERRNTADSIVKLLKLIQLANLGKRL